MNHANGSRESPVEVRKVRPAKRKVKPAAGHVGANWSTYMRDLGQTTHDIRESLGLTQDQLARLADVSQGAVSRLEAGRALFTPLVVVLRINLALMRVLEQKDAALVLPERQTLRATNEWIPAHLDGKGEFRSFPVLADLVLEQLIRLFHTVPSRRQTSLVDVFRALAAALS